MRITLKKMTAWKQRQMANNFIKHDKAQFTLAPILNLSHAAGLLPIQQISNTHKTSKISFLYSCTVLVTYLISSYHVYTTTKNNDSSNMIRLSNKILVISSVASCTIFLIVTVVQRGKVGAFLTTVYQITKSLDEKRFKSRINLNLMHKKWFRVQFIVGLILCVIITYIINSLTTSKGFFFHYSWQFLSCFILYAYACLFINCLSLINQLFTLINRRICDMYDETKLKQSVYDQTNNKLPKNISHVLNEIRTLAHSHDQLCDSANDLNQINMFQLLFYVIVVFISGLFTAFQNIKTLDRTAPMDEDELMQIIKRCVWAVYTTLILVAMMMRCTTTSNQASETGKLIHKAMIQVDNVEIHQMLKVFSLQVIHRHLQFNAVGMFIFDYSLLFSISVWFSLLDIKQKIDQHLVQRLRITFSSSTYLLTNPNCVQYNFEYQ